MCCDVGGGFDVAQSIPGQLADFNMWSYEMLPANINFGTCAAIGDIVSWNTLEEMGSSTRSQRVFPDCNGTF